MNKVLLCYLWRSTEAYNNKDNYSSTEINVSSHSSTGLIISLSLVDLPNATTVPLSVLCCAVFSWVKLFIFVLVVFTYPTLVVLV